MKRIVSFFLMITAALCLFAACAESALPDRRAPAEYGVSVTETETAAETDGTSFAVTVTEPEPEPVSSFEIYFIDVGQGDSACVVCDGKAMLIDGGPASESDLIYSFLKSHGIDRLEYIVATHPDADHIGGLAGALNFARVGTAYCTVSENDSEPFRDFLKYLEKQGGKITVPDKNDAFELGSAKVTVIYPKAGVVNTGNTSIALRIVYGETSFFFTGDCEEGDEAEIVGSGADIKSDVLKIAHHGSRSSTSGLFLDKIAPEYAVISVGGRNTYGHPADEVLKRLKNSGVTLYRTDIHGDIRCVSDGKTVTFDVEKNGDVDAYITPGGYYNYLESSLMKETETAETPETETAASEQTEAGTVPDKTLPEGGETEQPAPEVRYIANKNTMKFHYPGCSSVEKIKEDNKLYFTGTREELINMGYSPCGNCDP